MVKPIQTVAITGASGMVGQALIAELTVMLIHKFAPLPFCADGSRLRDAGGRNHRRAAAAQRAAC